MLVGMAGPDDRGDGLGGAEAALPAAGLRVRRDLVPAVLRARRRIRPRLAVDESRTRRRRVGLQRPEGVDDPRARRRLGDGARPHEPRSAEAQGPHLLPHRHASARHRGEAASSDQRRGRVQRGLPHRRAHARLAADRRRRRRLAGCRHHADERTHRVRAPRQGAPRHRRGGDGDATCTSSTATTIRCDATR